MQALIDQLQGKIKIKNQKSKIKIKNQKSKSPHRPTSRQNQVLQEANRGGWRNCSIEPCQVCFHSKSLLIVFFKLSFRYRQTQNNVSAASERADSNEANLAKMRSRARSASVGPVSWLMPSLDHQDVFIIHFFYRCKKVKLLPIVKSSHGKVKFRPLKCKFSLHAESKIYNDTDL